MARPANCSTFRGCRLSAGWAKLVSVRASPWPAGIILSGTAERRSGLVAGIVAGHEQPKGGRHDHRLPAARDSHRFQFHPGLDRSGDRSGRVINLDKLTYAGSLRNLELVSGDRRHQFVQGDIADGELWYGNWVSNARPWAATHPRAESHVDRSIYQPEQLSPARTSAELSIYSRRHATTGMRYGECPKKVFASLRISTDEVYGSLEPP